MSNVGTLYLIVLSLMFPVVVWLKLFSWFKKKKRKEERNVVCATGLVVVKNCDS